MSFVYKIQDITTGLYSTGGIHPKWTTVGKTWGRIDHLKNHLRLYAEERGYRSRDASYLAGIPPEWEIVKMVYSEVRRMTPKDLYD